MTYEWLENSCMMHPTESHIFKRTSGQRLTWSRGSLHKVQAPVRYSYQWLGGGSWQPQGRFRVNRSAPDCWLPNRSQESKTCGQSDKPLVRLLPTKPAADTWHWDDLWKPPGAPGVLAQELHLRARSTGHTDPGSLWKQNQNLCLSRVFSSIAKNT